MVGGEESEEGGEEELFHTPRGRDLTEEPALEWMYADARFLPLPGARAIAAANPLRWSRGTPDKVIAELEKVGHGWWGGLTGGGDARRPVKLRVVGQGYSNEFASAQEAAQWIRECETPPPEASESDRVTTIAAWTVRLMAAPALALYCRIQSQQPWAKKNLFFSLSYALRACQCPRDVSRMQFPSAAHPRVPAAWSEWHESSARSLMPFLEAAQRPCHNRPISVRWQGRAYHLVTEAKPSAFWALYSTRLGEGSGCGRAGSCDNTSNTLGRSRGRGQDSENEQVITVAAFGGANFDDDSFAQHPASPARSFIWGSDECAEPPLPVELLLEYAECGALYVVGYSLGGLAALGAVVAAEKVERPGLDVPLGRRADEEIQHSVHKVDGGEAAEEMRNEMEGGGRRGVLEGDARPVTSDDISPRLALPSTTAAPSPSLRELAGEAGSRVRLEGLRHVVLLAPTTMFWPLWYGALLAKDWWSEPAPWMSKVETWIVASDPLSDSVPACALKAPQAPGVTRVLPARSSQPHVHENHSFANFIGPPPPD